MGSICRKNNEYIKMTQTDCKRKPQIGVTTSQDKNHIMWWFTKIAVYLAGGQATRLKPELNENEYSKFDGYIISGGADISPALYNEENRHSHNIEPERDSLEYNVIRHALSKKKPLLGICRGAQMINVVLGGDLHQNVQDEYENFIPTSSLFAKTFGRVWINIKKHTRISRLFAPREKVLVNSIHHQAIKKIGEGLKCTSTDQHGITQAIEENDHSEQNITGVQWHPELMIYSSDHRKIIQDFVKATSAS